MFFFSFFCVYVVCVVFLLDSRIPYLAHLFWGMRSAFRACLGEEGVGGLRGGMFKEVGRISECSHADRLHLNEQIADTRQDDSQADRV